MEAICSSEMSADFQRTTRRYIPEDIFRVLSYRNQFSSLMKRANREAQSRISEMRSNTDVARNYVTINPEAHTDTPWSCRLSFHALQNAAQLQVAIRANYRLANLHTYYLAVMDC
jgi:hypothetical protein